MAFSEIEHARIEKYLDHFCCERVPPHAARVSRYVYRVYDDVVEIVELRPDPEGKAYPTEVPAVLIRRDRVARTWVMRWMRDDLQWHDYQPTRVIRHLEDVLAEVELDPFGCFFGEAPPSS